MASVYCLGGWEKTRCVVKYMTTRKMMYCHSPKASMAQPVALMVSHKLFVDSVSQHSLRVGILEA